MRTDEEVGELTQVRWPLHGRITNNTCKMRGK